MLVTVVTVLLAQDCGLEPPQAFPPVPVKPYEASVGDPPVVRRELRNVPIAGGGTPQPRINDTGALAGKTIYLSPGHGFTWEAGTINGWRTQRGNTNQIVEDLVSTETCAQYLMPMLVNAGARIVTVRELDLNTALAVVDDGAAGYVETGAGFTTSSLMGWGSPPNPLQSGTNPFALGANRLMDSAATATASASYTASLPSEGDYNVYVSYTAFTARVTDAHYVVKHAGGDSHFRVNQRRAGGTWVFLGRFHFKQGAATVQVLNDSSLGTGSNISLDAVRFGGGMGLIDRGGGKSGRPRNEESARYTAQYAGAPTTVYDYSDTDHNDDVGTRSRFAAWVHEPGEDAIYMAWHTNAFDGTARGTDVYVYGPNPPDGTYNFTGVAGSDTLAQKVHAELINDIRAGAGWNVPAWRDRGIHSAYFGELNPSHNNEMPAILMEIAFHDNATDAAALKEPAFRYLAARAITQGVIQYFNEKDGKQPVFPAEPPTHVAALGQGGSVVKVQWRAPLTDAQGVAGMAATKYKIYTSGDGVSWDDGVETMGLSFNDTISGAVKHYRVTAVNGGGESFPSLTVSARPGARRVLVVNAFDRLEASLAKTEDLSAYALGNVLRIFISRMNDGSYARLHADALGPSGLGVDTASVEALSSGDVTTASYVAVDFLAGRLHTLSTAEKTALAGKPLFFNGALDADPALLHVAATSAMTSPTAVGEDFLQGLSLSLADPVNAVSTTNATVVARYTAAPAAVGVMGSVVTFGFPFETISPRATRLEVMGRVMQYLNVITDVPDAGPEPDAGIEEPPDAGEPPPPPPVTLPELSDELTPATEKPGCHCGAGEGLFTLLLAIASLRRRR